MRPIDADALDMALTNLRFNQDMSLAHWGDRKDWCLHGYEVEQLIHDAPTIGGWISVKDRLPPAHDTCITAIKDDSGDTTFRYVYFGWYLPEGERWIIDDEARTDVYAWMPLPKPPKEDKLNEAD